jgi:hypothetical protein
MNWVIIIYEKRKRQILLIIVFFFLLTKIIAQHSGHHMHDTIKMNAMDNMSIDTLQMMSHSFSRNLPMNRNGSGTSWQPNSTPIYGYMKHLGKWNFMLHGNIYLRYTYQDINNVGTRGAKMLDAPNWIMLMGQRNVGKRGLFHFSSMFSLDRFTEGGSGYPLLFQTGESWNGKKLVDRQHPHDLFSELSVAYTHMINKNIDVTFYTGYPGEPAIGPTAFMHRISAFNNPDAPLGHHWQDATHITFGVATLGIRYKKFKLEGSTFTGREPNENRFDFDKPKFDSYSCRLSFNPTSCLSLQVSNAFLNSPESLGSDHDIRRTTASITYNIMLGKQNHFTNTFVYGQNQRSDKSVTSSFLLESNLQFKKLAIYGRYETVQKTAEDLALGEVFDIYKKIRVHAVTLGANYILTTILNTNMVIGIQAALFKTGTSLNSIYGRNPLSGQIYLRINPGMMKAK